MQGRMIAIAGVLLIHATAMAQAEPVAKVTSEQLVCQLSGDCAEADQPSGAQDKPATRGFSIARHPSAAAAAAPQARQPAPSANITSVSRNPAQSGRFSIAGPTPGRADLSINFVSGSAVLSDSGRDLAQTFMQALRAPKLAGKRFLIAGHTDAVGSRALNLSLSKRRAQALVDFLVQQGASRSQFDVKGFGFDRPVPGTSRTAPSNRRVEVVTLN